MFSAFFLCYTRVSRTVLLFVYLLLESRVLFVLLFDTRVSRTVCSLLSFFVTQESRALFVLLFVYLLLESRVLFVLLFV